MRTKSNIKYPVAPVSATPVENLPKIHSTVLITIIHGNQRITMRKDFENSQSAGWWFESFLCSLKNLFHFIVTSRM